MNNEKTPPESNRKRRPPDYDADEEVDEELLALAPPPPNIRHAILIVAIIVLSVFLMITFFSDLQYLFKGFSEPVKLGEVDQLYYDELKHNEYVELYGIPNITRSILADEGMKWFAMSDNSHKWFSLSGKQNLLVNWTVSDKEKAFRDPAVNPGRLSLPYDFKGQLVRTDALKTNRSKILLYFNCLELYSLKECKYCLGLDDMDVCRELFTCINEKNPDECNKPPAGLQNGKLTGAVLERAVAELKRRGKILQETIDTRRTLLSNLKRDLADIKSGAMITRLQSEIKAVQGRISKTDKDFNKETAALKKQGLDFDSVKSRIDILSTKISEKTDEIISLKKARINGADSGVTEKLNNDAGVSMQPEEIKAALRVALKEKKALKKRKKLLKESANGINDLRRAQKAHIDHLAALNEKIEAVKNGSAATKTNHLILMLSPKFEVMQEVEPSLKLLLKEINSANSQNLEDLRSRMDQIKTKVGPATWVLIDGETPIEKLWVILIYLVLLTMTFFNVRRLIHFIDAWRA